MSQVTTRPKTGTILQPKDLYHKFSNATDVSSWFYNEPVFWSEPIDFPCKTGGILASICHFFGLGPSSKGVGTNLKLSTNKIA
jgi:hypothetical protein